MKRVENAFRITKIGKTAVSVAVCGLMAVASTAAFGTQYNLNSSSSIDRGTTTDSVRVIYNTGGGGSSSWGSGTIGISLSPGVNLTGEAPTGGTIVSVYTSDTFDGGGTDSVTFLGANSILTLNGNNELTGIVGWHFSTAGGAGSADPLDQININGTGVTFNSAVYSNIININQGGTVQFFGSVDGETAAGDDTQIRYNGHNATVTLHNNVIVDGSITNTSTNGTLIFTASGIVNGSVGSNSTSIGLVEVKGNNSTVRVGGTLATDKLDYQALNATVSVGGNLDLNNNTTQTANNVVNFNGFSGGVLQVGGDIVGVAGKNAVTTTFPNTGTVTMLSGTQSITGNIGTSAASILRLNIGGANTGTGFDTSDSAFSSTTVNGNIFAQTVSLNNNDVDTNDDSHLILSPGFNITGNVVTETDQNGRGNLTLAGGTQTVTGNVGAAGLALNTVTSGADDAVSTFTGTIHATNVNNSGNGVSNYQSNVTATNVGVLAGTSNFVQGLSATTTTISSGTGNFNTNGTSTTSSAIAFTGAGTANLHTGLTGTIAYAGNNATVNLWHTRTVSGAVSTTTTNSTGILNARGSGVLNSTVGASGLSIQALNVNTQNQQTGTVDASTRFLLANGNIFATTINLQHDGELRLADGVNATGNITTTANNTGVLTLLGNGVSGSTNTVSGNVGAVDFALRQINAGSTAETDTFTNGVVRAQTLAYSGNGTVTFNGTTTKATTDVVNGFFNPDDVGTLDLGFVGNVDFGTNVTNTGTLVLGTGVDLITQHSTLAGTTANATSFTDANGATLTFAGSSVVVGRLGSGTVLNGAINTWGNDTFRTINAGANGSVVTFLNDVYALPSTFNVTGTGVVNFVGDLNSNLAFLANGSVNVADGQVINGIVTTAVNNTGTLNFVGGTTTQGQIGSLDPLRYLQAVNFHAASTDTTALPVTQDDVIVNIGHNVFATETTIGTNQRDNADATVANITANVFLGNNLTLTAATNPAAASNVTLNTAGAVYATAGLSPVDFLHTKNANGTLTNTAPVTQSSIGTGAFTTNGATLNFAIGTAAWADPAGDVQGAGGTINAAASSRITGGAGSTLVMNGAETVNLSLLGSLRDGVTYALIDVAGGVTTAAPLAGITLNDNSFVIGTALSRVNGDLVVTASRAAAVYRDHMRTELGATTHFADPAALRLGTLGRNGQDYDEDMQTVFNMLDIDQWGFGNNQANVATQAQRLSPIANNSLALSAFATGSAVNDSIGMRMHQLRIPESTQAYEEKGVWLRNLFNSGTQKSLGQYDGYKSKLSGVALGLDAYPSRDSLVGVSVAHTNTTVKQQDFRLGDEAKQQAWHLSMYAAYNFTPELFVDGVLTHSKVDMTSNRTTAVARTAKAEVDLKQTTAKMNVGYKFKLGDSATFLTPFVAWERGSLKQDAYTETGAGDIGLQVQEERLRKGQTTVGLRLEGTTMIGGIVVKPDLAVMSVRDSGTFTKPVRAQFIGDNTAEALFETQSGFDNVRKNTKVSLGLGLILNKSTSLSLRYETTQRKRDAGTAGEGKSFKSDSAELYVRWNF